MIRARESAVFLIASALIVCTVSVAEPRQKGAPVRVQEERRARVGTNHEGTDVPSPKRQTGAERSGVQPITIFKAIEAGLSSSNVKLFGEFLGRERILLEFDQGGPRGGRFAKGQAYYLLADYFRGTRTLQINFAKIFEGSQSEGKPFALLERVYRNPSGEVRKQLIFVCLAAENDSWVISEIRIVPAE